MKAVKILWACSILTFCVADSTQAQGWRGIKPLHSTRADVERLIGPPMTQNDGIYDLKMDESISSTPTGRTPKGGLTGGALNRLRTDVERLLGLNDKSYGVDYELTDGVLSIEYSS